MEDLDGDGRGDLYFLDETGTLTVYLGGERGALTDAQIIYWFYEGHDVHWEAGAGCVAGAGDLFGRVEVAATASGPATLYPDAPDGGWLLSGSLPGGEPWTQEVPGEALGLASLATPAGERLAVLHTGTGTMVSLYSPAGSLIGRVRFGALEAPSALVVLQVAGAPALGVLGSGPAGPASPSGRWTEPGWPPSLSGSTPSRSPPATRPRAPRRWSSWGPAPAGTSCRSSASMGWSTREAALPCRRPG